MIQHLADGGAERVVPLWAQMLVDAGYDVTVLTYYPLPNEYSLDPRVTRVNLTPSQEQYHQLTDKMTACKKLLAQYLAAHPQDVLLPHLESANLIGALGPKQHVKVVTQIILNSPWDEEQGLKPILRDWAIQKQGSVILQNAEQLE